MTLRPAAEDDLENIFGYTLETWGARQADKYYDLIIAMFARVATDPSLGRKVSRRHPDVLKQACGEHLVIFVRNAHTVEIVRVLHQRMDIESHLD